MAEKRMFSRELVESDDFLELPLSAQGLYMHICMEADDDGFVNNANRIRKVVEASKEDYQILFDRGYLLQMANGLVVVSHWKICNSIRKDRYKPTMYQSEWSKLRLLDNVYVLDEKGGTQTQSQSITAVSMQQDPPTVKRFEDFWKAYPRKEHKAMAEQEYAKLIVQGIKEEMLIASAKAYARAKDGQDPKYLNCPDSWLQKCIYSDYEVKEEKPKGPQQPEEEPGIDMWNGEDEPKNGETV
ncbi:MAG: hypothetical protein ACLVHD_10170 [Clostridium sp.]|mgnify:CR=1 FL=1